MLSEDSAGSACRIASLEDSSDSVWRICPSEELLDSVWRIEMIGGSLFAESKITKENGFFRRI